MRIIGGTAKGRRLVTPASGTRPMTGRVRESVFSILATRWDGANVLDLYAGSGSLGLEALSRGANEVVFVESGRAGGECIRQNTEAVGLGGELLAMSVEKAIPRLRSAFDVVFVDPPYAETDEAVGAVLTAIDSVLVPGGVVVLHRHASGIVSAPDFLTCSEQRRYGDAVVTIMEKATP
ncbi:MAG: 16S rRNA (guanine(966)-N(2))-methyltransferase RsmD [Acidimicrobiia bacterium]